MAPDVKAVVQRTGNTPMKLVIEPGRFMKFRMRIAFWLIGLAYRVGKINFEKPAAPTRAERRQRARSLAEGRKYAGRNQR